MTKLRFLLLQARRKDDPMREHERECFVEQAQLESSQIATHDLTQAAPNKNLCMEYDGLFVGGAGDYYASKQDLPEFDALLDFFKEVISRGFPTFASCFGFHCIALALGGEIVHDRDNTEVGSFELSLTAEGRVDELFSNLPTRFWAQQGHKDRITRYTDGIPNLASSERSPKQAFRIPGQPIWATQFHPELDRESNLHRFHHYQTGYAEFMNAEERRAALNRFRESPETNKLLPEFIRLVYG